MANIRFKKIKLVGDPEKLKLVWEQQNGAEWDEYSMLSNDEPHPDFFNAIRNLIDHVIDICELSSEKDMDSEKYQMEYIRHEIKGITFSHTDDILGATITSIRSINSSVAPMVVNTPHKIEAFYAEKGDDRQLLSQDCLIDLNLVIREANAFLKGKRAQTDMFVSREEAQEV